MEIVTSSSTSPLAGNIKQENSSPSGSHDENSTITITSNSSISSQNSACIPLKNPQLNIAANKLKVLMENKMKLENGESVSELLGSVIMDSCHGVRTSARVIQKMKENSNRSTTPPPERENKLKEDKSLQKTPSQARPNKVVWSNLERNFFFDAINEFGKDFDAISNYINTKMKRKYPSNQSSKTKEQVRTLYYQTFHKLSKYIKFSDDVKKPVQELYALINYGEMRRKLQFVSEKNYMKIKDLIYKGSVIARSKGKNIRIKTPSCKALRRLNQLEDWLEDIKLPLKVEVQLRPATMRSYVYVQNVAQNPFVRTSVPLQKKLINIIKTFQNKWRCKEARMEIEAKKIEQELIHHQNSSTTITSTTNTIKAVTLTEEISSISISNSIGTKPLNSTLAVSEPFLCLKPTQDAMIHRPLLSITEVLSSFNVCLNSYEERIGVKVRGETLCHEKNQLKRQRTESNCEKKSPDTKRLKPNDNSAEILKCHQQLKLNEGNVDNNIDLNSSNLNKEELKLTYSVDEFEENNLQVDFSEIICDSNDNTEVKFSRQDSSSDLETHFTSAITLTSETSLNKMQDNLIKNTVNNVDKLQIGLGINQTASIVNSFQKTSTNDCNISNTINSNNISTNHISNKIKKPKRKDHVNVQKKEITNVRPLVTDDVIRKIRKGWTISNAHDITVGDLYIVFGSDSKLVFEYCWTNENYEEKSLANITNTTNNSIINHQSDEIIFSTGIVSYNADSGSNNTQEHEHQLKSINRIHASELNERLKQLLVIANLSDRMKKKSCFCGHACDKFSKPKIENEFSNRAPITNRLQNWNDGKQNNVFRQPLVPCRKSIYSIDAYKSRASKVTRAGTGLLKSSNHLFVQRVLPVQPGIGQRYDILKLNTNDGPLTKKNNSLKINQNNGDSTKINESKSNPLPTSNLETAINQSSLTLVTSNEENLNSKTTKPLCMPSLDIENISKNTIENGVNPIPPNNLRKNQTLNTNDQTNDECSINELPNNNVNNQLSNNSNLSSISNLIPDLSPIMELSLPSPLHTPKYLNDSEQEQYSQPSLSTTNNSSDTNSTFQISIPSISPTSLLRCDLLNSSDSSKWLDENINDYSLSSLLGHLDEINNGRDITNIERTNLSSNLSIISESSVDYVTKFAEIAASIQNEEKE